MQLEELHTNATIYTFNLWARKRFK